MDVIIFTYSNFSQVMFSRPQIQQIVGQIRKPGASQRPIQVQKFIEIIPMLVAVIHFSPVRSVIAQHQHFALVTRKKKRDWRINFRTVLQLRNYKANGNSLLLQDKGDFIYILNYCQSKSVRNEPEGLHKCFLEN